MPSENDKLVNLYLRGNPAYADHLDCLFSAVESAGVRLSGKDATARRNALAEYALADLSLRYGLGPPPARVRAGRGPGKATPKAPGYQPRSKRPDSQATQITTSNPDTDVGGVKQ